jgi:hypothetical protein
MDYTRLSLGEVRRGLEEIARDADARFGRLDARQLNWRPDATRWSVAQCFEHLLTANRLMLQAASDAMDGTRSRTVWERIPVLPGLWGRMLIRSQAPNGARKFKTSAIAQPAASDLPADIVARFVAQQDEAVRRIDAQDEGQAARVIMTSPFIRVVTYSVLDGWRLMVSHDRRHLEQARRVTESPEFPKA